MTIKQMLQYLMLVLLLFSVSFSADKPNIVIILMDDVGYANFGVNYETYSPDSVNQDVLNTNSPDFDQAINAAKMSMPYIQTLAAEGIRFTDAHAGHALCAPTRSSILTGRYPQSFGVYNNVDINNNGVPTNVEFLPEILQQNGYKTAMLGKWHVAVSEDEPGTGYEGYARDGQHPNDRGFDYYFGFNHSGMPYINSDRLWENKTKVISDEVIYTTDLFTDKAIDFINANQGEPKLIYMAYNANHGPLGEYAPAKYDDPFKDLPKKLRIWNSYSYAVDENMKRIMNTLESIGEKDNTLFIFTADNGASGSTPLPANGHNKGFKGTHYLGGSRVPMVAWWPGQIGSGKVSHEMVSLMDLLPTALDAAGLDIPASIHGKSLLPLLKGENPTSPHNYLVWANRNSLSWSIPKDKNRDVPAAWTLKKGDFVLHFWDLDSTYNLYNIKDDIGETIDIKEQNAGTLSEMIQDYSSWFTNTAVEPLTWDISRWKGLTPFFLPNHDLIAVRQASHLNTVPLLVNDITPEFVIKNNGLSEENNVLVYCEIDSAGTLIYTDSTTVEIIKPFEEITVSFTSWSSFTMNSYDVKFYVQLPGDEDNSTNTISSTINITNILDDFESGFGNWSSNANWGIDNRKPYAGEYSMVINPNFNYGNSEDSYALYHHILNLSSINNPHLTFWSQTSMASGDYGFVEISVDEGINWDKISNNYTGSSNSWKYQQCSLLDYSENNEIQIRFHFISNMMFSDLGWFIDDIKIESNSTGTSMDERPKVSEKYILHGNYPNPFNPETMINYRLGKKGKVSLKIYDTLGREIRTIVNEFQASGEHSVKFIASNLPSGIYTLKLKSGNFEQSRKMTLLR